MRKGIISKFSMGVALAAAAGIFSASAARADLDGTVTYTEPAGTLVMPFDETTNHKSYQIVTRVPGPAEQAPVATHWSYWSDDCQHLVDVFICLTPDDTIVVDPTSLQGEVQTASPPANVKVGAKTNLTGHKGVVTITAFLADTGSGGQDCRVTDPEATETDLLVGSWTIANTSTQASFGNDAIGLDVNALPDAGYFDSDGGGVRVLTYNPQSLEDSAVLAIGLKTNGGNADYTEVEVGPIGNASADLGGNSVCCNTSFVDNLEFETSLPDFCFKCFGDHPIVSSVAEEGDDTPVIPPTTEVDSPGFVHLTNCEAVGSDGVPVPLSDGVGPEGDEAFVFVYHGQAVGSYGTVTKGKYSGEPF